MKDVDYYTTVAQICSAALRNPEVSGNFQNSANTMTAWQESLVRLEAAKAAEEAKPATPPAPAPEPPAPSDDGPSAG